MSLKKQVLGAVVVSLAALVVQAGEPLTQTGEQNFQQFCAACHGAGAQGDGPVAASLNKPVPDLTLIAARNDGVFPFRDVRSQVDGRWDIEAHGTKMMPVWGYEFWVAGDAGNFDEASVMQIMTGLVEYIESLQQ
jgi:mono/diheme cytochrome c family protein